MIQSLRLLMRLLGQDHLDDERESGQVIEHERVNWTETEGEPAVETVEGPWPKRRESGARTFSGQW